MSGSHKIDVLAWKRLADIYDYAAKEAVPLEQAIETLVNRGLSHITPPWQQLNVEPYHRPGPR